MVANSPGSGGGFGSSSPSEGPTAGFDPMMSFKKRNKVDYRKVPQQYRKWVKNIKNKY